MPQSHHTPGPRRGCSRAVLNKNRTFTHGARTGPVRRRTIFAFPYEARRVLMHALLAYGSRTALSIVNSPWRDQKGPRMVKNDASVGFLSIMVVSIPLRVRKGTARHPCGSRTGPVVYEKHWRNPCGARTRYPWSPANYSTKPWVCRRVKPYGARSLMWQREQHRRKIPTGASFGLTCKKSYGW